MTRASLEARVAATLILVALAAGCGIDGLRRTDSGGGVFPNGIEPPDTQVAVGPSHVVEIVNYARMRVIDKAHLGTFTDVDLHGVVGCPGLIADPRVQYDAASGRWFISLLQTDSPGPAAWCLAVSTDGNPSSFYHYEFDLPNNYYPDYQGLGIGDDKVVLTGDLATGSSDVPGGSAAVLVVRKSDVTAGVAQTASMPRRQYFAPDPAGSQYFPLQPAMALSPVPGAAVYVAGVDSEHAPTAALVRQFTGLPHASGSGVTVTSTMVGPLGSFAQAPAAQQKGTNVRVPSSHVLDNRIQSVVYRDGSLWLASQAACTPAGDTQARSCLRLVEIQPSGSSLPVNQDITFGTVGDDYFYPAITLDAQDDLVAVFNRSSANEYVSVYVSGRAPTDALGTLRQPPYLLKAGQVFYQGGAGRWGDYSGAAVDPSNPLLVWLGAEYPLPAANGVPQWGTWLGLVSKTFIPGNAAPTVTSISPASGPTTGGTAVIITGTGFQSGATVKIGGVVATRSRPWVSAWWALHCCSLDHACRASTSGFPRRCSSAPISI